MVVGFWAGKLGEAVCRSDKKFSEWKVEFCVTMEDDKFVNINQHIDAADERFLELKGRIY